MRQNHPFLQDVGRATRREITEESPGVFAFDCDCGGRFSVRDDKPMPYSNDYQDGKGDAFFGGCSSPNCDPDTFVARVTETLKARAGVPLLTTVAFDAPFLSEVKAERIDWLWRGYLPLGKLTILDGDPKKGKSTLSMDLAARLTTGRPMPFATEAPDAANVILITNEDDGGDTIKPRLIAAGGDPARVRHLRGVPNSKGDLRPFVLPDDVPLLRALILSDNARLVIIDPLMNHIGGGTDVYRDNETRARTTPLAMLAQETGTAVLVLRHLTKGGGGSALYRGSGSVGIAGAARSLLLVGVDKDDPQRRVLAQTASNVTGEADSLGFGFEAVRFELDGVDVETSCLVWHGVSPYSADDLCAPPVTGEEASAQEGAEAFLLDLLKDGSVASASVQVERKNAGISERRLEQAQRRLGVKPKKDGMNGGWVWTLPDVKKDAE